MSFGVNDILPVRRIAVDSRYAAPLSGHEFSGSHFSYRTPWPLTFPKGTKVRCTEASFAQSSVDNVTHARGLHWSEKRAVFPFVAGSDPVNQINYISGQLDVGTISTRASRRRWRKS